VACWCIAGSGIKRLLHLGMEEPGRQTGKKLFLKGAGTGMMCGSG